MRRLQHGYTNETHLVDDVVVKRYRGPDIAERQARELGALRRLADLLPVPEVVESVPGALRTRFVAGHHGQELIESGLADEVLASCGRLLRLLQAVPNPTPGAVVVHGDFGPNNVLLTEDGTRVLLLADWEWSTGGSPRTDLAWCEWIVRMHHPEQVAALAALFDAYGDRPGWPERQRAMLDRCAALLAFARRWPGGGRAELWEQRIAAVGAWRELPG